MTRRADIAPVFVSADVAAQMLMISRDTFDAWVRSGFIPSPAIVQGQVIPSLCKPLPKALKLLGAMFARHTGTDANMTGTDRNAANTETTLADRYGAGVESAGVTSDHILRGLEHRHQLPRWVTIRELPNATAWKAARRIDLFAIGAWPSENFETVAYEVKVSRSDFLRDIKDHTKQRFSRLMASHFYFATTAGIVKPGELPDWAGLIEFRAADDDGYYRKAGRICVPAPDLPRMPPTWPLVACLTRLMAQRASKTTLTTGGTDDR